MQSTARLCLLIPILALVAGPVQACAIDDFDCVPREASDEGSGSDSPPADDEHLHRLPFLGAKAREAGYTLPRTFGAALVYTHLSRDIEVTDLRVGRNGTQPQSVESAQLATTSDVDNLNLKFDTWILPFLNVYAMAGTVQNHSQTTIAIALPPLLPGGAPRSRSVTLPTYLDGSVGGVGVTLAGGYKQFFAAVDVNWALADLGFDDEFKAIVSSLRIGWNGEVAGHPLRSWVNATKWDTAFTIKGSVIDPDDGSTLRFEVDQGPAEPWTYGGGVMYSPRPWFDFTVDAGWDFEGGWYAVLVPTMRW